MIAVQYVIKTILEGNKLFFLQSNTASQIRDLHVQK